MKCNRLVVCECPYHCFAQLEDTCSLVSPSDMTDALNHLTELIRYEDRKCADYHKQLKDVVAKDTTDILCALEEHDRSRELFKSWYEAGCIYHWRLTHQTEGVFQEDHCGWRLLVDFVLNKGIVPPEEQPSETRIAKLRSSSEGYKVVYSPS